MRTRTTLLVSVSLAASFVCQARAQDSVRASPTLSFTLLDAPYNVAHGVRAPSMQQSLDVTAAFYEWTHSAIARMTPRRQWLANLGIVVFDFLTIGVPFADAWLHEEWHRAVLGRHDIGSRNDVYNLNVFASVIAVSHVQDEELAGLKQRHPVDFVRLKAAGIEGEAMLVNRLERDRFFRGNPGWHVALSWFTLLNTQAYVGWVTAAEDSGEVDRETDDSNRRETTIAERDISGHDFTAWVYDLFRPNETFALRGAHPSGVGIDRYIKVADLTAEEKRFLRNEGRLSWLNFVDPNLFGIDGFGRTTRVNAWLRHMLTSFGHTVDGNVLLKRGDTRIAVSLHRYTNGDRSFPGLTLEAIDWPTPIGGRTYLITPRDGSVGGMLGARVVMPGVSRWRWFAEIEGKTAGWVAGNPSTDRQFGFRLGGVR
jgi:hypothetical protein